MFSIITSLYIYIAECLKIGLVTYNYQECIEIELKKY